LVDGAYYSEDIAKKAKGKNIKIVPTTLVDISQKSENSGYEKFEIDEKRHVVKRCSAGHKPIDSTFKNKSYRTHFNTKQCNHCLLQESCPVIKQKKIYLLIVSEKGLHRSQLIAKMGTSKYQQLARKRTGIEGIPSVLRRRYNIDHLQVRGLVRSKVWLGFKISSINCRRLIKVLISGPRTKLSNLLYNHLLKIFSFQRAYTLKFAA
jgi:hypothetical protein